MSTKSTTRPVNQTGFREASAPRGCAREAAAPSDPTRPRTRDHVTEMPTGDLENELLGLARRLAAGTYELLVLVGEFDERGSWALRGALSCAAWLAEVCDIEVSTARTQVRVARALRDHPLLDTAMRNGDISYAKARVLVPYLDDDNAADLIGIAEVTPAGRLGAAIAARSQRLDDPEVIARRQAEARSCSWRTAPDGMVTITARLTPAAAGAVCAVIDAVVTRTHVMPVENRPGAPADASELLGEPAFPSLAQQRADAFVEVTTSSIRHSSSPSPDAAPNAGVDDSGASPAGAIDIEVVVHITADGNHLTDGTPLADHTVTSMLPDAFVSLLLHDTERQPIDASPRRRFPTRRQRRIIDERSPECAHPGCHARTFLQYDHIQPYRLAGPTTIDNLRRLCGPHNRARNEIGGQSGGHAA